MMSFEMGVAFCRKV